MVYSQKFQVQDLLAEIFGNFEVHDGFTDASANFIQNKIKFPYHLISGKYYIKFTRGLELECVVNDMFGSYRLYIQNGKLMTEFPENYIDDDEPQLALLNQKGYSQGEKTSDTTIQKIPPCSVYRDNRFIEQLPEIKDISSSNYLKRMIKMISGFKEKKIGVAFSGGQDSLFLIQLLLLCKKTPVLYHMKTDVMDKSNKEDLDKSQKIATKLDLGLEKIVITSEDRQQLLSTTNPCWRNDRTNAFLNIRCFLKKINDLGQVKILVSGQNADTFINHGITRKLHLLDIYQLICHKTIFRNLFEKNRISIFSKLILLPLYLYLVDRSIKESWRKIPNSKSEFVMASISENSYLPILNGYNYENFFDATEINYDKWYFLNKLNNHIGGNHSIAWSDDSSLTNLRTVMPYSSIPYLCFSNSEFKTLRNIFSPKRKLERVLQIIDAKLDDNKNEQRSS